MSKHQFSQKGAQTLIHIRPALTDSMAATVAASVVQSRLDYANTHLYRTPASNIHKLHCAENFCLALFCLITQAQPAADYGSLDHL